MAYGIRSSHSFFLAVFAVGWSFCGSSTAQATPAECEALFVHENVVENIRVYERKIGSNLMLAFPIAPDDTVYEIAVRLRKALSPAQKRDAVDRLVGFRVGVYQDTTSVLLARADRRAIETATMLDAVIHIEGIAEVPKFGQSQSE